MENTIYEWIISAMECRIKEGTLDNVVTFVHWRLNATRDEKVAETYSVTAMPQPSGENFTPYDELTKEQVVDWLVAILSVVPEPIDGVEQQSELTKIKVMLNVNIELQLHPVVELLPPPFEN